jgi:hypothetical protein
VLEALLKRVDGLEKRLKDEKRVYSSCSPSNESGPSSLDEGLNGDNLPQRPQLDTNVTNVNEETAIYSPTTTRHAIRIKLLELANIKQRAFTYSPPRCAP